MTKEQRDKMNAALSAEIARMDERLRKALDAAGGPSIAMLLAVAVSQARYNGVSDAYLREVFEHIMSEVTFETPGSVEPAGNPVTDKERIH